MKYDSIDNRLFIDNRKRFISHMKPHSIAIFVSNDEMPRSADGMYKFRQNPDLFYLSGIDQEQTTLILFPDAPNPSQREILFVRKTNQHIAVWEGHKYTKEEAMAASGVENVQWNDSLSPMLHILISYAQNIYLNQNDHDRAYTDVPYKELRLAREIRNNYPLHNFERASIIMHKLRSIKSPLEVAQIRKACEITEKAFRRVLSFVKAGVYEYEIEAEIIHEFLRNRATGHAYEPIIASGTNANVLHYNDNNQVCKSGDLILMDFGADYANYCADLSRTIPVNGKFTPRQKEVYNAVLSVFKQAKEMLHEGNNLDTYHKAVGEVMQEELIKLGLLNAAEVKNQVADQPLYKRYFMHGTSHYLGLDVHDVGSRFAEMKAGMVFTCEPGIYIPEEGFGIRIENDILLTESGNVDLMESIPIEADHIEDIMQSFR
jgi:Xaa-Pro aminopeptidase